MSPSLQIATVMVAVVSAGGCKRGEPAPQPSPSATDSRSAVSDDSQPVYPLVTGDPDPVAGGVCAALQDRPRERRAACKGTTPGVSFAGLCTSALTAAMRSGAVRVDPVAAATCGTAIDRALQGCDWVGAVDPPVPLECDGFVRGLRGDGASCRSSLECVEGLRCHGVGPTSVGRCGRPRADGDACGVAVDPLVAYARQDRVDTRHPECTGFCADHRCAARAPRGGACRATVGCSADDVCVGGHCVAPP
jgi:hypothetical protein